MDEQVDLKPITAEGVEAALERASHYRLLNQPEQAESICLDILEVDPDNQRTLVVLALAITDQFALTSGRGAREAYALLDRVTDEYERLYYSGIVAEREARALLTRGPARVLAYKGFHEAMRWFEQAEAIRPAGNDDAILRWNACVRTIVREGLRPRPEEVEVFLE